MSHVSVVVVGGDNDAIQVMDSSLEVNGNGSGGGLATSSSSPSSSSHGSMEQRYLFTFLKFVYIFNVCLPFFLSDCTKWEDTTLDVYLSINSIMQPN